MTKLDDVSEAIGALRAEVTATRSEIAALKAKVDDLTAYKNRGLGIIAALTFVAGLIGYAWSALAR